MEIAAVPQPAYRQATLPDLDGIAAIEAEVFDQPYQYQHLRQLFEVDPASFMVADLGGAVVGYTIGQVRGRQVWLLSFGVACVFQSRGYGRALLDRTLRRFEASGSDAVCLTVAPDNLTAYNLFKQKGFEFVRHDERYFGPGEPRDVLACRLRG
ncbi:GNAT family N-acetyltransferase [Nocardia sp. BMG111209]|uniref:GNAT family N-acetyltransferase n=1 Tax=Nocardia sp. BMG111209 TaxID=1160137 RepID=UPI00035D24A7|nr:N-acetyltransferase [Nocardia sp. BMG111209]